MRKILTILIVLIIVEPSLLRAQLFKSTFESGSGIAPEIGTYGANGARCSNIANPHVDDVNSSNYVIRVELQDAEGAGASTRYGFNDGAAIYERKLVYMWKQYLPTGIFDNANITTGYLLNIKRSSWTSTVYQNYDHTGACQWRCVDNAGIVSYSDSLVFGQWVDFVLEIYHTQTTSGYSKLYRNSELVFNAEGIQTIIETDSVYNNSQFWVGSYLVWDESTDNSMYMYFDDMYLYDITDSCTLEELRPDLIPSVINTTVDSADDLINAAALGYDTVFVSSDITGVVTINASGTESKPIHIHGVSEYELSGGLIITGDYVEFENLKLTGTIVRQ